MFWFCFLVQYTVYCSVFAAFVCWNIQNPFAFATKNIFSNLCNNPDQATPFCSIRHHVAKGSTKGAL